MSKLADKILKKVKKANIKHKPRWQFIAKRIFIWSALIVAIILLSMSVSMIIHQMTVAKPVFSEHFQKREFSPIFKLVPYFWTLISLLLLTFAYFDFKQTKTGHRHRPTIIVASGILVGIIIAAVMVSVRAPHNMEEQLQRHPLYQKMHFDKDFSKGPGALRPLMKSQANNPLAFPKN
ncbi:hypothetical protein HN709_05170 [Candidatus Peregrinibacteria bacterium]|jgi:hypothetical protein|nr:hypothetical protein [Candidatus Peregrinibacteria bacterium]MBT7737052.1 hypothetical protein [Candidatus Peregrinibacteria bacterium]